MASKILWRHIKAVLTAIFNSFDILLREYWFIRYSMNLIQVSKFFLDEKIEVLVLLTKDFLQVLHRYLWVSLFLPFLTIYLFLQWGQINSVVSLLFEILISTYISTNQSLPSIICLDVYLFLSLLFIKQPNKIEFCKECLYNEYITL